MNSQLILLIASLHNLAVAQAQSTTLTINTPPSVPQCLPTFVSFSGGQPPYTISALPGGQPSAPPLADLGSHDGTGFTWKANLPVGTSTTLQIRDSTGVINYSQMFTIQPSSDTSCLGSGSQSAANPTTTGPPAVTTATAGAAPSPKPGNDTGAASGTQRNMTSPATMPNATSSTSNGTNSTGAGSNSTKGPSPFVPPTSNTPPISTSTNNNNNANPGSNSGSSVVALSHQALCACLGFAALAIFA